MVPTMNEKQFVLRHPERIVNPKELRWLVWVSTVHNFLRIVQFKGRSAPLIQRTH
jgi:hypothetical protein